MHLFPVWVDVSNDPADEVPDENAGPKRQQEPVENDSTWVRA